MASWQVSGYTEQKRLGAGATGRVVLATHNETGVPVAIKYLTADPRFDPEFFATFRDEAQTLLAVDDPNVVRLYEYVETEHGAAIVMELVNGVTLRTLLAEAGPTTPEAALHVLKGSLLGLLAAHRRGMVHRDYKPANVLVDEDGTTKLADFGTATAVGGTEQVGTPAYMAPEQWTGSPASTATDIYAATATWFECLTGKIPFEAPSLITMREAHLHHPVPTGEVPNDLQGLAARGMAKDPGERPPDAAAFIEELEATARRGYGAAWEERGRGELARRVALLALLLPLGAGATTAAGAAAIQITRRATRGARQLWTGAVAAAAVVLAIIAGIVAGKAQPPPTPTANVAAEPTLTIAATLPPTTPPPAPPTSASPSPSPSPTPTPTHTHTVAPPPPPPPPSSSSSSKPPPPPPGPTVTDLTVAPDVFVCPNVAGAVIYCATAHVHVATTNAVKFTVTVTFSQKNSKSFTVEESGATSYDFDVPSGSVLYAADICTSPRDTMTVQASVPAAQGHDPATSSHLCEPGVIG